MEENYTPAIPAAPTTTAVAASLTSQPLAASSQLVIGPESTTMSASIAPAMPAPKTQAPQRPRRLPAVDPSTLIPARRSSTRSIKRKKFDDELVESSLVKTERGGGRSVKGGSGGGVGAVSSGSTSAVAATSSPGGHHQHLSTPAGQAFGVHTTTPSLLSVSDTSTILSDASSSSPSLLHTTTTTAAAAGNVDAGGALSVKGGAEDAAGTMAGGGTVASSAGQSSVSMATALAAAATAAISGGGVNLPVGHSVTTSVRGKDHTGKGETASSHKLSDNTLCQPPAKPPAEKRSRPSSGKSNSASKGGGGGAGKVAASRQTAASSKAGGSKVAGSRAGVSKTKSRVNARSKSKRSSRKQKDVTPAVKDLGRWKPQDDLALITAVQQTNDLSAVHTGVKFSCRFTLKELEERWYALLYDPAISKIAMEAARQLHQDTVATIQGKALYSNAEEKLLGTIASASQPGAETFQSLLQQHPDVFHPARTAKTLLCHWLLMKQYHLLPDQTVQPMPRGDHILNLSDIEDFMNDDDMGDGDDEMVEREMALVDRRNKREIRHLEQELPKWQVLVDSVTGISMPDFDSQTLGVLRGRLVRYLMRSREISLGRSTKDNHVDVDLSLEGPAWKVSRRQGIIKLRNSGDFFIANEGKRPILVDGKPVLCGNKQKLNNNSVVEISCLRFTFLINLDVINAIRADATKPGLANTLTAT